MAAADPARFSDRAQKLEQLGIADHEIVIGHVYFEGAHPGFDHLPDLLLHFFIPVGDGHMKGDIAVGMPFRIVLPEIQGVRQAAAFVLCRKIDDRGGSPGRCGSRAGFKIIGSPGRARIHLKMRVFIDKSRKDITAFGVNDIVVLFCRNRSYLCDAAVFKRDVFASDPVRGYQFSVADDIHNRSSFLGFHHMWIRVPVRP